jgi:hypothetical protein
MSIENLYSLAYGFLFFVISILVLRRERLGSGKVKRTAGFQLGKEAPGPLSCHLGPLSGQEVRTMYIST